MAQLPDVYGWIKVIKDSSGKAYDDGAEFAGSETVTVRYSFANDSHIAARPLTVAGALFRDGTRVQPNGQPNVVPAQQVTLQPGQVWSKEYQVSEYQSPGSTTHYRAKLLANIGGNVGDEESDRNNQAIMTFSLKTPPS